MNLSLIPLWVYLAGILPVIMAGMRELGARVKDIFARAGSYDLPVLESVGWGALVLLIAGLWPIAVPAAAFFFKGKNIGDARAELKKKLKLAEDEIYRIQREEGWKVGQR